MVNYFNMVMRSRGKILILSAFCFLALLAIRSTDVEYQLPYSKAGVRHPTISCENKISPRSYLGQWGQFWVLYNYVKSERTFGFNESVTYSTPADTNFLDHIVTLVEHWQGPVSVALYVPDRDFESATYHIEYLRECVSPLVKDLATFHLFFDQKFIPSQSQSSIQFSKGFIENNKVKVNCSQKKRQAETSFRHEKHLSYPINVARNIAREMATTHFVLWSDIELFPSLNFIPKFLHMIKRHGNKPKFSSPSVFVLPVFEVEANVTRLPADKFQLKEMLKNNTAIPFHNFTCSQCHAIPMYQNWLEIEVREDTIDIFHTAKRTGSQVYWEPFFVGTKNEPMFDERLSWEGRSNKMTQNFIMCILDYDYRILDNAFLVHSPGIKRLSKFSKARWIATRKQSKLINDVIAKEIQLLYGERKGCFIS